MIPSRLDASLLVPVLYLSIFDDFDAPPLFLSLIFIRLSHFLRYASWSFWSLILIALPTPLYFILRCLYRSDHLAYRLFDEGFRHTNHGQYFVPLEEAALSPEQAKEGGEEADADACRPFET
jgi:hypothetical protein